MFIRYFVEIPAVKADVETVLLESPASILAEPARDADTGGNRLLTEIGFGPAPVRLTRPVKLGFGDPIRFPSKTVLPITWKPTSLEGLIPSLEADLEIAELGPWRTQLSISARYAPPLGAVGRSLDRALLHRVAEATVRDFVDRAAARIDSTRRGAVVAESIASLDVGASFA